MRAGPGSGGDIILCADDFAISEGVSRAIVELAEQGRLSATGAMVNLQRWDTSRTLVAALRKSIAVGLHLNLTTGAPLGPMPSTAPAGVLPPIGSWISRTLRGALDAGEIADEINRQLDRFEDVAGAPPDFIDGHHHVHVLAPVRLVLLEIISRRYRSRPPLVRCPPDRPGRIFQRRRGARKALVLTLLGWTMPADLARAGVPTNDGFSGFSAFDPLIPFNQEMDDFLIATGPRHMVMCHPGYPDEELRALDPLCDRRFAELTALATRPGLKQRLWRPARDASGWIDWSAPGHG